MPPGVRPPLRHVRASCVRMPGPVGALRAEVSGHDVSVKSRDKGRFTKSVGVDIGAPASKATA